MSIQAVDVGEARPSKYDRLIAMAKAIPPAATLVVHPCDESSLRGVVEAADAGLIKPTLVGPASKIKDAASKHDIDISRFDIVFTLFDSVRDAIAGLAPQAVAEFDAL